MSQVVAMPRKPPKPGCPLCRRPTAAAFRPFCSARCKDEDMRRWLTGEYRIPTPERPEDGEEPA